jgi:hypothetical protein
MRTRILAALAVVAATALFAGSPAAAAPPALITFRVTISGTASGNPFTQTGTLTLHRTVTTAGSTNGVNPLDVCLRAGFPAGLPAPGAIWLGSNSACFPIGRADLDMGAVNVSDSRVDFEPDGRLQATLINLWTARGSVVSCPYAPVAGSAIYRFDTGNRLSGSVRLSGYGGAACGWSTYSATVAGVRIA